ncbi:hypothetical protein BPOR_0715g00030 [Botrytis porri]|uniref:Uncharacterized protein n=1 Tax=Botrytis porri TaxID=87229 RepID=A0A4Z1KP88_9HELO|nr:hypothetical protein BPOR_0715g00030 [Botrytis porri]
MHLALSESRMATIPGIYRSFAFKQGSMCFETLAVGVVFGKTNVVRGSRQHEEACKDTSNVKISTPLPTYVNVITKFSRGHMD